jgi:hypothetical protein
MGRLVEGNRLQEADEVLAETLDRVLEFPRRRRSSAPWARFLLFVLLGFGLVVAWFLVN